MAEVESAMITARFEGEDLHLLQELVELERLNRSDVLRRAVRAYAEQLGIKPKPRAKPKRR